MAPERALLSRGLLRRLATLRVGAGRRFAGAAPAGREGLRRGTSLEFADFREYAPGDDLRRVDWNVWERTGRPFVRTYVEEEDLFVYLLVDASASMRAGEPSKLDWALQLAAALGYVALAGLDRVAVGLFDERLRSVMRPLRGKGSVFALMDFLGRATGTAPGTSLVAALREHALVTRHPGVAVVLSDFLDPRFDEGLAQLVHRRYAVHAVQVLAPEELSPPLEGEVELEDVETGQRRPVSLTPEVVARYRAVAERFVAEVGRTCRARGVSHVLARTDRSVEDVVLRDLRAAGVVS